MENIEMRITGDLARIVLRRPPLNYLNLELMQAFESHIDSLGDSPECRALIVESEGKAFCAGLDIAEQTRQVTFLLIEQFHRIACQLNAFPRPTIAIVRGMALGAGNELAACCDFVFASETASFGQPEVKFGSIPSLAPLVLPPLIGSRRTQELILTGDLVGSKEAAQMGLIHSAIAEEKLGAAVDALVSKFRRLSLPVAELALEAARISRLRPLKERLREVESLYLDRLVDLEDCTEGTRAFLEKRAPIWHNR
jgi:cyclohexa-1,5-dienecarbonyl-CoA hydratase